MVLVWTDYRQLRALLQYSTTISGVFAAFESRYLGLAPKVIKRKMAFPPTITTPERTTRTYYAEFKRAAAVRALDRFHLDREARGFELSFILSQVAAQAFEPREICISSHFA